MSLRARWGASSALTLKLPNSHPSHSCRRSASLSTTFRASLPSCASETSTSAACPSRRSVMYVPKDSLYPAQADSYPGQMAIPNTAGVEVAQHQSKVYSGQYSADGNFLFVLSFLDLLLSLTWPHCSYAASQAMRVYIYDTRNAPRTGNKSVLDTPAPQRSNSMYRTPWHHRSSMKTIKTVKANQALCQWTVTDATLSADNQFLCYSSVQLLITIDFDTELILRLALCLQLHHALPAPRQDGHRERRVGERRRRSDGA